VSTPPQSSAPAITFVAPAPNIGTMGALPTDTFVAPTGTGTTASPTQTGGVGDVERLTTPPSNDPLIKTPTGEWIPASQVQAWYDAHNAAPVTPSGTSSPNVGPSAGYIAPPYVAPDVVASSGGGGGANLAP
jgi:hypothetical protein